MIDNCMEASVVSRVNADLSTTLFTTDFAGSVVGIAAATGAITGPSFYEGEMIRATPAVYQPSGTECTFYFEAGDGVFYAIDAFTGKQVWNSTASHEKPGVFQSSSAALYDNGAGAVTVYFGTVEHRFGRLLALDAKTGQLLWNYTVGSYIYAAAKVCCVWCAIVWFVVCCGRGRGVFPTS